MTTLIQNLQSVVFKDDVYVDDWPSESYDLEDENIQSIRLVNGSVVRITSTTGEKVLVPWSNVRYAVEKHIDY